MNDPKRYTIDGPAGALEVALGEPEGERRGVAVICHPHPLYGGTLDNKVAYTLARAAEQQRLAALRFNFRGVGDSEGLHDGGEGELDDALAAIAHLREQFGPDEPLLVAGFSFGGWISLHAAARSDAVQLVTVAPALSYTVLGDLPAPGCPWFYIHGEADDVVPAQGNRHILETLQSVPDQVWLPEVGHFFHGHLTGLRRRVTSVIDERWSAL